MGNQIEVGKKYTHPSFDINSFIQVTAVGKEKFLAITSIGNENLYSILDGNGTFNWIELKETEIPSKRIQEICRDNMCSKSDAILLFLNEHAEVFK